MSQKVLILFLILIFISGCKKEDIPLVKNNRIVTLYNWTEYTEMSILKDFEKETGIKVILHEYETMPMMISEVQSNPGKYDVIIMDGSIVSIMKELKLIEKLDLNLIPNYKNVKENLFEERAYDHMGSYSTPHLWGTTGLVYNTNYVRENIDSWSVLWDKKYKNKIALMDDPREVMTVLLKISGYSLNSKIPEELKEAEKNGLLLRENGIKFNDTMTNIEKVITGELWIAEVYNGDVFYKIGDRKDIKFINPLEGFNLWGDYLCISYDSNNKEGAYALINYFLRPDISGRFANTFCYASPIKGAEKYINKKILENTIVYPSGEILRKGEFYIELGQANKEYERIFNLIKQ